MCVRVCVFAVRQVSSLTEVKAWVREWSAWREWDTAGGTAASARAAVDDVATDGDADGGGGARSDDDDDDDDGDGVKEFDAGDRKWLKQANKPTKKTVVGQKRPRARQHDGESGSACDVGVGAEDTAAAREAQRRRLIKQQKMQRRQQQLQQREREREQQQQQRAQQKQLQQQRAAAAAAAASAKPAAVRSPKPPKRGGAGGAYSAAPRGGGGSDGEDKLGSVSQSVGRGSVASPVAG